MICFNSVLFVTTYEIIHSFIVGRLEENDIFIATAAKGS